MVKVTNALLRTGENGPFVILELTGDLEMVQSSTTGRFYGTVRKCSVSVTVDLETAKGFIGKHIPGSIVRVKSDPYQYALPETGELITLANRYDYIPDQKMVADYEDSLVGRSESLQA